MDYETFLKRKAQFGEDSGFDPLAIPDALYPFQRHLLEWSLIRGRAAIFADCGLGKTPIQLAWADNVVRHTGKPVLIMTPLAVSYQAIREAQKFGFDAARSSDGNYPNGARIVVTNYERLHFFDPSDFSGAVCDESSILKNFDGKRKAAITDFMRAMPFRMLCTATAAPNDYVELGTSSEALGGLGHLDMLQRFFKNDQNVVKPMRFTGFGCPRGTDHTDKWRFKPHAEPIFWKWVSSWARACRRPSDLGFSDESFALPELFERTHIVKSECTPEGLLFAMPGRGLSEERAQKRRTIRERCEAAANLVAHRDQALVWCHLNAEGDLLADLIPDSEQVAGSDTDEDKEARLAAFANGEIRVLITKPKIGAWGLNLQRCAHVVFFPSHSYEQYYQSVRRCYRFGQTRPVTVDIVATEAEGNIMANLARKAEQASRMFDELVSAMSEAITVRRVENYRDSARIPAWL